MQRVERVSFKAQLQGPVSYFTCQMAPVRAHLGFRKVADTWLTGQINNLFMW